MNFENLLLIHTKLYPPKLRTDRVLRPQLLEQLERGINSGARLILLTAPAGTGKTTLLCEWLQHSGRSAAWLSIGEADDEISRFLHYLVTSVSWATKMDFSLIYNALNTPGPVPVKTLMTHLVNTAMVFPGEVVVVLDGYHHITQPDIHEALAFLLDYLPDNFVFVIASRESFPISCGKWVIQNRLLRLDQAQLNFCRIEAEQFLTHTIGLDLAAPEVDRLMGRTEGWIAGLKLLALSASSGQNRKEDEKSYFSDDPSAAASLVQEMLDQQPSERIEFLLKTCLLEKMTSGLCEAVTGCKRCQEFLDDLEKKNLFVIPLDHDRTWFRYQNFFKALLEKKVRRQYPEMLLEGHSKASLWYERHGFFSQAIWHAIFSKDYDRACFLIEDHGEVLFKKGDFFSVKSWLSAIPADFVHANALLNLFEAVIFIQLGDLPQVQNRLSYLETYVEKNQILQDNARLYKLYHTVVAAFFSLKGDPAEAKRVLEKIIEKPSFGSWKLISIVLMGDLELRYGNIDNAENAYTTVLKQGREKDDAFALLSAMVGMASVQFYKGHPDTCIDTCTRALDKEQVVCESDCFVLAELHMRLAQIHYQTNRLEASEKEVKIAFKMAEKEMNSRLLIYGNILLTLINTAKNNIEKASNLLKSTRNQVHTGHLHCYEHQFKRAESFLMIRMRQLSRAGIPAAVMEPKKDINCKGCNGFCTCICIPFIRNLIEGHDDKTAICCLNQVMPRIRETGKIPRLLEARILLARALDRVGEKDRAVSAMEAALLMGHAAGYIRFFADCGNSILSLLHTVRQKASRQWQPTVSAEYVLHLIKTIEDEMGHGSFLSIPAEPMTEPLTEREMEILLLLASGQSNPVISDTLSISVNTVKTHIKNIFDKLLVNSRTQAVARARQIGLIP
ncbi:LuxR C-terminal-related transcriptional regulator [Desulfobacula phenolica]|uniref:Regulatory protein, luxR family n=1 Tax=Desulfobacula phenolica TaxID=90732 RepID=A0A1H2K5T0_9BACT|nr:LuxR C-terminal-related transcriptional regulator [Desulfobacula phenolica]SDU63821.1 regulatory protein, luxR family [Desulfobacula phenolica]